MSVAYTRANEHQDQDDPHLAIAPDDPDAVFGTEDSLALEFERSNLIEDAKNLRSHTRLAYLAAARCVDRFLHVAGLGWFSWDGKRFVSDVEDKAITRAVVRVLGDLAPEALGDRELLSDLVRSQTSSGLAGVVRVMSTIESLTAEVADLDADPYLLNTPTGVLNLRDLERVDWDSLTVRPHSPAYRMTQITRGGYDPLARSALWDRFLARSLPDEGVRCYMQQTTGVGLIGEQPEHMLPINCGAGRNGKGVSYLAILHTVGDYGTVANANLFNVDRNATADKPNPSLLDLRARRIVFISETAKSVEMDAAKIKALTGGDPIKARGVHSKVTICFYPSHLLVLITNHAPQLPADDPAVWERVRNVPWDVVVPPDERDPMLAAKLRAEADGILMWALRGLQEYLRNGLTPPARVSEATQEYKAAQDTVANFIEERCEDGCSDRDSESTKVLHADYQRHCRANGVMREHILGERDFGARLDELGYPSKKSGARRFRQGLRLLLGDDEARMADLRAQEAARAAKGYQTNMRPAEAGADPQPAATAAGGDGAEDHLSA